NTPRSFAYYALDSFADEEDGLLDFVNRIKVDTEVAVRSQRYMVIFDLNLHASLPRLHIINLQTGYIRSVLASHGRGSDCGGKRVGYACKFISDRESEASPLGFFATDELFKSKNDSNDISPMIRLNGLEGPST